MIPPATPGQLNTIYQAMPADLRISVLLGAVFALRISEICALQVGDFDFDTLTLHLRHALQRGEGDVGSMRLAPMKTASSYADIPIPRDFVPLIKRHIRQFSDPDDKQAMVIRAKHVAIMNPSTLRDQFVQARVAAGRPDLHFHTLRATGITEAAYQGATLKEVQEYGRHDDSEVSIEHYQRAKQGSRRASVEKVYSSLILPERTPETVKADITKTKHEIAALQQRLVELNDELDTLR